MPGCLCCQLSPFAGNCSPVCGESRKEGAGRLLQREQRRWEHLRAASRCWWKAKSLQSITEWLRLGGTSEVISSPSALGRDSSQLGWVLPRTAPGAEQCPHGALPCGSEALSLLEGQEGISARGCAVFPSHLPMLSPGLCLALCFPSRPQAQASSVFTLCCSLDSGASIWLRFQPRSGTAWAGGEPGASRTPPKGRRGVLGAAGRLLLWQPLLPGLTPSRELCLAQLLALGCSRGCAVSCGVRGGRELLSPWRGG